MSTSSRIPATLFELGQVVVTPGVARACGLDYLTECLMRHVNGDWGCVSAADAHENDLSVRTGFRLLSAYPIDPGKPCEGYGDNCLWIITEGDRSTTTFLLPSEY